jgi:hypothetical protein
VSDLKVIRNKVPLGHANRAIEVIGAVLVKAVSMKTSRNVFEMIVDCEDESVAIIQVNLGRWPLAVDADDPSLLETIGVGSCVCNIPFESLDSGEHRPGQAADHQRSRPPESDHFFRTIDASEAMPATANLTGGRPSGSEKDDGGTTGPLSDRTTA